MKMLRLIALVLILPLAACDRHHDRDPDDTKPVYIKDKDGTLIPDPNCKNGKCPYIHKPAEETKK